LILEKGKERCANELWALRNHDTIEAAVEKLNIVIDNATRTVAEFVLGFSWNSLDHEAKGQVDPGLCSDPPASPFRCFHLL
jgi:hypothetical protein